jgi:hypothetical protein
LPNELYDKTFNGKLFKSLPSPWNEPENEPEIL